jgi:hypothetical protein
MAGAIQTVSPVVFDYAYFQAQYPAIAEWCSPGEAQGYFDFATMFCDNSGIGMSQVIDQWGNILPCRAIGSPVTDVPTRQRLLGLLTAHIATLIAPLNGEPSSSLVGRISSASEGSVSVSVDLPMVAGEAFYAQTKFGFMFWTLTARYRLARYFPPQPYGTYGGLPGWGGRF